MDVIILKIWNLIQIVEYYCVISSKSTLKINLEIIIEQPFISIVFNKNGEEMERIKNSRNHPHKLWRNQTYLSPTNYLLEIPLVKYLSLFLPRTLQKKSE